MILFTNFNVLHLHLKHINKKLKGKHYGNNDIYHHKKTPFYCCEFDVGTSVSYCCQVGWLSKGIDLGVGEIEGGMLLVIDGC